MARWEAYKLPVNPRLYVTRDERLWIPVEITLLDESFHEAWRVGAEELAKISAVEQRRLVVDTAVAWRDFPPSEPSFETSVQVSGKELMETAVAGQRAKLGTLIDATIRSVYLDPMQSDPDNSGLRTRLLQVYVALQQYDAAISAGLDFLIDERGDKVATHNHIGIAYYLKGEIKQAAYYFKQALAAAADDAGVRRNLDQALRALGRSTETPDEKLASAIAQPLKGDAVRVDENSFYWLE